MSQPAQLLSDEQLASQYRITKERSHLGELFNRYKHLVYGVCLKYLKNEEDSRDAMMDIFERLIHDLPHQDIKSFKNWLYFFTRNHCINNIYKHRKTKRDQENFKKIEKNTEEFMEFYEKETLYNRGDFSINSKQLKEALELLEDNQRTCVKLFFLEAKRYKQIVTQTGFSMKQVKSYLQNGKRNLKKILLEQTEKDQ